MKRVHSLLATLLAGLLVACLIAAYAMRNARPSSSPAQQPGDSTIPIEAGLLQTAKQMSTLAESAEEQDLERDALRLADHELDQTVASALREAAAYRPSTNGPLKELADRIAGWKQQIETDKDRVTKVTAQGAAAPAGELELAQSQVELDRDELEDAQQDLARQGGATRVQPSNAHSSNMRLPSTKRLSRRK